MKEIVVFKASWCGPCKNYEPIVQEVSEKTGILIRSVNIDSEEMVAMSNIVAGMNDVRSVPTTVIIKEKEIVDLRTGVMNSGELKKFITNNIE